MFGTAPEDRTPLELDVSQPPSPDEPEPYVVARRGLEPTDHRLMRPGEPPWLNRTMFIGAEDRNRTRDLHLTTGLLCLAELPRHCIWCLQ